MTYVFRNIKMQKIFSKNDFFCVTFSFFLCSMTQKMQKIKVYLCLGGSFIGLNASYVSEAI